MKKPKTEEPVAETADENVEDEEETAEEATEE